jgi:hypothetical protein
MTLTQSQRTAMYCTLNTGIESYDRSAREQPDNADYWREKAAAARDALAAFERHFYGEQTDEWLPRMHRTFGASQDASR